MRPLQRFDGRGPTTSTAATRVASLGDVEQRSADRFSGWLRATSPGSRRRHYQATEPTRWDPRRCIRQADLVLLDRQRAGAPTVPSVERSIADRSREPEGPETELVLVHPAGNPKSPRHPTLAGPPPTWTGITTSNRSTRRRLTRAARLILGRGIGVVFSGAARAGFRARGPARLEEHGVPIDACGGDQASASPDSPAASPGAEPRRAHVPAARRGPRLVPSST